MITAHQETVSLYEQPAKLGHALSSPQRLRLLHLLAQGERTVEASAEAVNLTIATTSHHLQILRRVHLVVSRKVGRHVTYALADADVLTFWLHYREFSSRRLVEFQAMRDALAAQRQARGTIDRTSLQKLIKSGKALLLDLRPEVEFDAGHLPGAVCCPFDKLFARLKTLPSDKTLVLYCRGPLCLLADAAQQQLAARGITALQYSEGVAEWASAGLPVKRSPHYKSLFAAATP